MEAYARAYASWLKDRYIVLEAGGDTYTAEEKIFELLQKMLHSWGVLKTALTLLWGKLQKETGTGELRVSDIGNWLGCSVVRDREKRITYIHQAMAMKLLPGLLQEKCNMLNCNGPGTPLGQGFRSSYRARTALRPS